MDYRMREHLTNCLKQMAETLSQLEAIFVESESDYVKNEIAKIQHRQVNLQNHLTRIMYLEGEGSYVQKATTFVP